MIEALLAPDLSPAHLVGIGAAVGALLRHWIYTEIAGDEFPWPTLIVNALGSFALGLLAFGGVGPATMQLLGVGLCGAFTTFSTFSVETVGLWERGERRAATTNAVGTLVCSLAGLGVAGWLVG
ncbi:Integral membrane protein possibly involved in chromosome condensation [Halovivax ruber XH-70]|uniref:Fluoride-specific ion channel FluC n=1 Tax=Halovivax ruber (strain DSM 18193 / JCM 13892 / XH-70) TaxID=797302 RepID=L0IFV1_HALRX|nr:CrcB family protein [Halovivax ruber]AGB17644.1 Integral membrane protein possibly involved in chromosome condensation [Halovivax ruber XH-70]